MLSIGKIGAGPDAGRYYERKIASGVEDYYTGKGEAHGVWLGTGARGLGLRGRVGEDEIVRLLAGEHPASGAQLRKLGEKSIAGFDLTFKAPKSVALIFGTCEQDVSDAVRDGHDAAVREAIGYLERHACVVRRGKGGPIRLPGEGFVAAAFRHRTSRAGDPLLHTHVVIANHVLGPDGRRTALFGTVLYDQAKTAGYVYQAVLRQELCERLGVVWEPVVNGTADIEGIPRKAIVAFSKRRQAILTSMRHRGEHSARAAQIAALDTRRQKTTDRPARDLREAWRRRALRCGLYYWDLPDVMHRPAAERDAAAAGSIFEHVAYLLGPSGLTESCSSFDRRDVVMAFAQHARQGARAADLEAHADDLLRHPSVVRLTDGRYSTAELLGLEARLLRDSAERDLSASGTVDHRALQRALRARPTLGAEQRDLVTRLTTGLGGLQVVRAPAGTGKTFALDAAREAWEHAGVPVMGCALSARAAIELRDQTAIPATTIAQLKLALDTTKLARGSVLVVDEAGMVGTRDLARLHDAVKHADGRLVLVGDDKQLPEIQAGGAFAALADQHPAPGLSEIRRQDDAWDRQALTDLREGKLDDFARAYLEHDRITLAPTATAARDALVADWWTSTQEAPETERSLMIAARRADVRDLNDRARQRMRDAGHLGPDELTTEDRGFATGDRVVATRNDRHHDVHNGQTATLTKITEHDLELRLDTGGKLKLPVEYAHEGHLDHGYAMTAHRAQGTTVTRSFVLGSEDMYREWGYTALTRHKQQAQLYLSASRAYLNQPPTPLHATQATPEQVVEALRVSRRKHMGITRAPHDHRVEHQARTHQHLRDLHDRIHSLESERDATPWYQRSRRHELDRKLADLSWRLDDATQGAERQDAALTERPPKPAPGLAPATDPLLDLETDPTPDHDIGRDRDLDFARTLADDIGPDIGL